MNSDQARDLLKLSADASADAIREAAAALREDLNSKRERLPTDALKAKFDVLLARVNEAEKILLA